MANKIKVALSPFYVGGDWTDEVSGITFQATSKGQIHVYDITNEKDLEGIKRALRLNVLLLLEGSLDVAPQEVKVEEAKEEPKEEPKEESKEEKKDEAPAEEDHPKKHHHRKKASKE